MNKANKTIAWLSSCSVSRITEQKAGTPACSPQLEQVPSLMSRNSTALWHDLCFLWPKVPSDHTSLLGFHRASPLEPLSHALPPLWQTAERLRFCTMFLTLLCCNFCKQAPSWWLDSEEYVPRGTLCISYLPNGGPFSTWSLEYLFISDSDWFLCHSELFDNYLAVFKAWDKLRVSLLLNHCNSCPHRHT